MRSAPIRIAHIAPIAFGLLISLSGCTNETRVIEIEPNQGTFSGGEEVMIKGTAFPRSGVQVRFGTKPAGTAVVESDHTIKVFTPAGDKGTISDVSLVFDDGRAFVLKNSFRYVDSTQQRNTMDKFFNKASGEK